MKCFKLTQATFAFVLPITLAAQAIPQGSTPMLRQWTAPQYWRANRVHAAVGDSTAGSVTSDPLVFVAITPCRVVDTRASQGFPAAFGAPSLLTGASRTFPIPTSTGCNIPATAEAYSLNITVVPPGPLGFITAYPTGQPLPLAATVNAPLGGILGNAAVVAAGTAGSIDIFASNPTDVVIDINGYYAAVATGSIQSTNLVFPLVTNTNGFDTSISISNVGTDTSSGSCNIFWIAAGWPFKSPTPLATASVPSAGQVTVLASTAAPGFQGYAVVHCPFNAQGLGFVGDVGFRNLAFTVPAVVTNNAPAPLPPCQGSIIVCKVALGPGL